MKILDEKGRLFGKLNLIDLLVILAILYGLYFVGTKVLARYFMPIQIDKYIVTLRAESVQPEIIDSIKVGDKLIDRSGSTVGVVVEPKPVLKPSEVYVQTREGTIKETYQPKLKDMDITLEVIAPRGARVKYNTQNMLIGSRIEYDFAGDGSMIGIHVKAVCTSIQKAGNQ